MNEVMPVPDNKPKFQVQVQWSCSGTWLTVQLTFDSRQAAEDYIATQYRDLGVSEDAESPILFRVYDVHHKVKFRAEWKWMAGNMEMRATHADPTLREAVAYVYQNVSLDNGGIHELTFTKVEYDEFV